MGAWGPGMRANDTALDAVYVLDEAIRVEGLKPPAGRRALEDIVAAVIANEHSQGSPQGVLGLAEAALERGISLDRVRLTVDLALASESSPEQLTCWRDPQEREAALGRFRDRLNGVQVDEALIARDNEGLLSRIFRSQSEG